MAIGMAVEGLKPVARFNSPALRIRRSIRSSNHAEDACATGRAANDLPVGAQDACGAGIHAPSITRKSLKRVRAHAWIRGVYPSSPRLAIGLCLRRFATPIRLSFSSRQRLYRR